MQLVSALPALATADDHELADIAPNVLIILDTSSRMAETAPSNAYVAAKKYSVQRRCQSPTRKGRTATAQPCQPAAVFKSPAYGFYAESPARIPASDSTRRALAESGTWSGTLAGGRVTLYSGNYVNYLFAHCGAGGACPQPKLAMAKRALGTVVDSHPAVRFGLMAVDQARLGGRGARLLAPIGDGVPALKAALAAVVPAGNAPLGDALYEAGLSFKGATLTNGTSFPSPIELACQSNHVIVVADGARVAGRRSLMAEASLPRPQDHASSHVNRQRVNVHTVALAVDGSDRELRELEEAADRGEGTHFHAVAASELEAALRRTLGRITRATYTLSTPVVPGPAASSSARAYLASFEPTTSAPFWRGSLTAYRRDPTGGLPVDADGRPLASGRLWDAARALNALPAGRRTIYTEVGGTLTPFTKSNGAITNAILGVSSGGERNRVIDLVRGGDGSGTRDRAWKLGAIVHSTPVVVSPPVLALTDPSYEAFKAAQAKRTNIVIVGADDGMLHAFRDTDGVEVWAFIPPDMLDRLSSLFAGTGTHRSFADGSPVAVDIKVGGTWRTVVLFGCRRGGASYYALDITDTTRPKFLWRFTDGKIHETWSTPAIGRVKLAGQDSYVAFVGGGPTVPGDDASGKALFALDVATGAKLWEYANVPGATDDRRHMLFALPTSPVAVDADNDGYVDRVYSGDAGGQMWKFDVTAAETSGWKGKRLFAPASNDDVASESYGTAPGVTMDRHRKIWLLFGTTARQRAAHAPAPGRFFALRDDGDMTNGATLSEDSAGIKDVSGGAPSGSRGWYLLLSRGERVLGAPNVFNGTALFTTLVSKRGCAAGGTAKLYAVRAWTGQAALDFATGGALEAPTPTSRRFKDIGHGDASVPLVITTRPLVPGTRVASFVITSTVNREISTTAIPAPASLKQLKSWRERSP